MRGVVVIFVFALLSPSCHARPAEQSEPMVNKTQSTTAGSTPTLGVYHQIASNIAERITSPIYRFLGINTTSSENTTRRASDNIELPDDLVLSSKDVKLIDNHLSRDAEELISDAALKNDRKPDTITLYSSYLPSKDRIELNETNGIQDDISFTLDDVDDDLDGGRWNYAREGPLTHLCEWFRNVLELLWSGVAAWAMMIQTTDW